MRSFRRQHEQLRSVIIRVLRPQRAAGSIPTTPTDENQGDKKVIFQTKILSECD